MPPEIERHETSAGRRVYRLPVMAFPSHVTNCYLILDDVPTLLDAGSGLKFSNDSLDAALARVAELHEPGFAWTDVKRAIATHGHIDHFGGLNHVVAMSGARVGVHELDLSTIRDFEERLIVSSRNLHIFLRHAGMDESETRDWVGKNKWSKNMFKAMPVDFTIRDGEPLEGGLTPYHAPGHCPGQVCLGLDDVLFTADHVLARITPNQSPESIIHYNGLGHYYDALRRIRSLDGYRIGLGGHEESMPDVRGRIDEIVAFHDRRLDRAMEICREPKSIREVAAEMFPNAKDYHVLLALTEAGAHVEYLHERGRLVVTNLDEIESAGEPVPRYRAVV